MARKNYGAIIAQLPDLPPQVKEQLQQILDDIDKRLNEAGV